MIGEPGDSYGGLMEGHDAEVSDRLDALLSTVRDESAAVARNRLNDLVAR